MSATFTLSLLSLMAASITVAFVKVILKPKPVAAVARNVKASGAMNFTGTR
ncbi:hypothetical protein ACFFUT_16915 [Pseudohalocynthiibacter aestuariivivens]|uniref:Uncharacterized protein n=1 Tax=Pseudohalocynthiibacter aestuariivivens TaxID=1591409 RepID=A0ABV5JJ35_9RHOB|nr:MULTISPECIES: hypothetical protein [Pseudohalocynthiibacter]MBS9716705.1 hypothetical protein [Pseudohalocynthiibacter aestuariivivens]MCK0101788.1 hypothetical protein [Pseudohalocynthiibacter sp. F2068]